MSAQEVVCLKPSSSRCMPRRELSKGRHPAGSAVLAGRGRCPRDGRGMAGRAQGCTGASRGMNAEMGCALQGQLGRGKSSAWKNKVDWWLFSFVCWLTDVLYLSDLNSFYSVLLILFGMFNNFYKLVVAMQTRMLMEKLICVTRTQTHTHTRPQ